ncbi:MAG: DUF4157 domain-containing protein [Aureispira sp.]
MLNQHETTMQQPYQAVKENDVQQSNALGQTTSQENVQQPESNKTGIPDNLKAAMEYLYGISLQEVRVHYNSDKPIEMGAYAYAEGLNIYIAPGQEKYLAHELGHVVQQLKGEVKETVQFKKGVAGNDEGGLERKADKDGKEALKLAKVPDLLPQKELEHRGTAQEIIQRAAIKTNYGTFNDDTYNWTDKNVVADISFEPAANTDATKIGLTQTVKRVNAGKTIAKDPNQRTKMSAQGDKIDTSFTDDSPVYGAAPLGTGKTLADTPNDNNSTSKATKVDATKQANANYELGHHYKKNSSDTNWQTKKAGLLDTPTINAAMNSSLEFETTAVALEGAQKGMYYGSVKWGYKIGTSATTSGLIPFAKVSDGVPSKGFMETADKWNKGKVGGTLLTNKANTLFIINGGTSAKKLPAGLSVHYLGVKTGDDGKEVYASVKVNHDGKILQGFINIDDLTDQGDGAATHDLPLVDVQLIQGKKVPLYKDAKKKKRLTKLPQNSRVKVLNTSGKMKEIEVVDGKHTGTKGWVTTRSAKLQKE